MSLAEGAPLLRKTIHGFAARPSGDVAELMKGGYDGDINLRGLLAGLDVVANALNRGDLGRAMIASVQLGLSELNWAIKKRRGSQRLVLIWQNTTRMSSETGEDNGRPAERQTQPRPHLNNDLRRDANKPLRLASSDHPPFALR